MTRLGMQGLWEEFTQGKFIGWVGTELGYKKCLCLLLCTCEK